jgi:hypothetical protein
MVMLILDQIKDIKSGRKELRTFGLTMAVPLAIIGAILLWKGSRYYPHLFIVAAAFLGLGLVWPVVLKPFQKFWMTLSILMGWVMTRVILILLYYLVFTPVVLTAKLFGKRFIESDIDKNAGSYWVVREEAPTDKSVYERQF